jgi:hypothetical protein
VASPFLSLATIAPFRILASDEAKRMPPLGSTAPLMMEEKLLLIQWLTSGSLGAGGACAITDPAK